MDDWDDDFGAELDALDELDELDELQEAGDDVGGAENAATTGETRSSTSAATLPPLHLILARTCLFQPART